MLPGIKMSVGSIFQSITSMQYITTLTSTTTTLTIPNNDSIFVGDIAVWINSASSGSAPTYVTPSGFTLATQASTASGRGTDTSGQVFFKIITQSDIGTTFTGMSGTSQSIALMIFRSVGNYNTLTNINFAATSSGAALSNTLSTTGVIPIAIGIVMSASSSGHTLTASGFTIASLGTLRYAYTTYNFNNIVPASQPTSCTDGGSNVLMGGYLLIA